ncbi:MAG: hypothetical protein EBS59_09450, partial [Verrucomicrobia bacterium]|nr:hypothetical protein [Verrucomicrobiota bacterium]
MAVLEGQSPKKFNSANGDKVFVRGYPSGGWGDNAKIQLVEEGDGIYSATISVPGDQGLKSGGYKFYIQKGNGSSTTLENGGFEAGLDREFDLTTSNTDLPVVYFSNIRSFVTFAVDMNVQKSKVTFNPTSGQAVELKGSFNDWGAGVPMIDPDGDGIYTVTLPVQGNPGTPLEYKFTVTGSGSAGLAWEGGLNRSLVLGSFADATPLVTYGNDGTTFRSGDVLLNSSHTRSSERPDWHARQEAENDEWEAQQWRDVETVAGAFVASGPYYKAGQRMVQTDKGLVYSTGN